MIKAAGYDSWRWNGFAQSLMSESPSSVSAPAVSWDSVSAASESTTALLVSSGASGVNSFNTWQWGGFSRSTPDNFPTNGTSHTSSSLMLLQAADLADESVVTTSLSGYVYFDQNGNGKMETTDWAIVDAELSLTKTGSVDPPLKTYTTLEGTFTFDNLSPGTYSIALLTPCPTPGKEILGQLYDADGNLLPDAGKVMEDGFYDIVLEEGYKGVNYLFCESSYPAGAVSKRLLINGGPQHTVPEPASLALLAIAGLVLGAYSRQRK